MCSHTLPLTKGKPFLVTGMQDLQYYQIEINSGILSELKT